MDVHFGEKAISLNQDILLYIAKFLANRSFSLFRGCCRYLFNILDDGLEVRLIRSSRFYIDRMVRYGFDRFILNTIKRYTAIPSCAYSKWSVIYAIRNDNLKVLMWLHVCSSRKKPHPRLAVNMAYKGGNDRLLRFLISVYYDDILV